MIQICVFEDSLHPWKKFNRDHGVWCMYNVMLSSFLLEFWHVCSSVILASSLHVCVLSFSGFGIRAMVALWNEFGNVPSLPILEIML